MAETSYGVNDALAVKLWSKKLFQEALKETYVGRFVGTSSNSLLQRKDETSKQAGDKITYGLRMQLSGAGVQGDTVLEGNEEALTTYSDSIYINQLRHAVKSGGKMSEQRVPFSVREEAMMGLKDWFADRIDTSFFNQLAGNTVQSDTKYTGNNSVTAPSTNRIIICETGSSAESDLDSNDTFNLSWIDHAVTRAKTASPLIRPIRVNGNDKFVLFLHPYQVRDLRTNTSTGQWLDIQKAAMSGGQVSNNPIYTGALGEYNGVVLHESTRIPTGNNAGTEITTVRRGLFCGAQSGCIAFGQGFNGVSSAKWTEKLFDYENQLGVSGAIIMGLKKNIFNSEDFGTIVLSSYAASS
jgi:N4-gp56 family major capsid protein